MTASITANNTIVVPNKERGYWCPQTGKWVIFETKDNVKEVKKSTFWSDILDVACLVMEFVAASGNACHCHHGRRRYY